MLVISVLGAGYGLRIGWLREGTLTPARQTEMSKWHLVLENNEDMEVAKDDRSSFRPTSLQTFGPKNSFDGAAWIEKYRRTII